MNKEELHEVDLRTLKELENCKTKNELLNFIFKNEIEFQLADATNENRIEYLRKIGDKIYELTHEQEQIITEADIVKVLETYLIKDTMSFNTVFVERENCKRIASQILAKTSKWEIIASGKLRHSTKLEKYRGKNIEIAVREVKK